jgi:hypothetical protein
MSAPPPPAPSETAEPWARVEETHISTLFFVGDRVYKLHKPVDFGFLDFTSREAREADCHREVDLNRRLAPDVYVGVADIVMDGAKIDHLVVMRSLPEARQLQQLLQAGTDVRPYLDQTANALASFHTSADRSERIAASGTPAAIRDKWTDDFAAMDRFAGSVVDEAAECEIRVLVERWLGAHAQLLHGRVAGGHICDGHGDLQASDIFCLDDGVRILDCLEFSDALRQGDVCTDVAFLAMDLIRLGHPELAHVFVDAYERSTGALLPPALLHFYIAHRAYIRALVACIRAEHGVEGAATTAAALHALARRHLVYAQSAVVLVGGLPGAGKTTLARALGMELGWTVLGSDPIRRTETLGQDRYTPQAMAAVYGELFRQARDQLRRGRSVILDASWIDADERARAAVVAQQAGAAFVEIQCCCPDDIAAERVRHRIEQQDDASEATEAVRRAMAGRIDPWPSAACVDTTAPAAVENAIAAITNA